MSGKKTWKAIYYVGDFPRWYHIGDADAIGWVRTQWPCEKPSGAEAHLKNRYREEYAKKKNKSWQHTDKGWRQGLRSHNSTRWYRRRWL